MIRPRFALVTGASTGIGYELARAAAEDGCNLLIAAEDISIEDAAGRLRAHGTEVEPVRADLATEAGVAALWDAVGERQLDYVMANAGRGLGHTFLDQDWDEIAEVIHLNVTGTCALLHRAARHMREFGAGRILVTGSIAGGIPGSHQAVYNATKAYIDNFSWGLREELSDHGVSVTCLMPGPVETEFFERAGMEDTPVGQSDSKADSAKVARSGYQAMKKGASGVTPGFMTSVQSALSGIIPEAALARLHRSMAEPKGGSND